jgi:hypothetical protein
MYGLCVVGVGYVWWLPVVTRGIFFTTSKFFVFCSHEVGFFSRANFFFIFCAHEVLNFFDLLSRPRFFLSESFTYPVFFAVRY